MALRLQPRIEGHDPYCNRCPAPPHCPGLVTLTTPVTETLPLALL